MTAWRDSLNLGSSYTQLKDGEIRLLKFEQPGNSSAAPSIHHKALKEAPPYCALSYRWQNDNDKREPAQFKGHWLDISGGPLSAVEAYLSGLVGRNPHQWFWIDQFCIDQSNVEEKNQQVSIMGDIFRKASETIIFLGSPRGPTAHFRGAFEFLEDVARLDPPWENTNGGAQGESNQMSSSFGSTETKLRELLGGVVEHQSLGTVSALVAVLSAPWFSRAWVVQEAVLCDASVALCGPLSLDWARFCIAIKRLDKFGYLRNISRDFHTPQNPWQRRVQTLRLFYNLKLTLKSNSASGNERKLAKRCHSEKGMKALIKLCRPQEATNESDKVFALAGLCEPEDKPVVDYEQPPEAVYRSLALRMLQEDHKHFGVWDSSCPWNALGVLALVNADYETIPSPSWVPDWTTPLTYNDLWFDYGVDTGFCASGGQQYRPTSSEMSPETLLLRGKVCSKVVSIGRDSIQTRENRATAIQATEDLTASWWKVSTSKDESTASERLNQWLLQEGGYLRSNMPEDGQREERIARTLCAGIRFETTSEFVRPSRWQDVKGFAPIWEAFQTYSQGLSQGGSRSQITEGDLEPDGLEKCFKAFRIAAGLACRGRRLFITDDRHIGLGPGRMEEGDIVSVIYGAHWPFVLRPVGKQFQIVGYCYVDGIMGGEMTGCADTSVQDFCIV